MSSIIKKLTSMKKAATMKSESQKSKEETVWLTLRVEKSVLDQIKKQAEDETRTVSNLVRIILDEHLKRSDKK